MSPGRLALLTAACATLLYAPGLAGGSVFDSDDAIYAEMAREMVASGDLFDAIANELGEWTISAVPAATYRVTVKAGGFKVSTVPDVKVDAAVPAAVNVTLELGSVTETIEVTGADGQATQWVFEMQSPNSIYPGGYRRTTFKEGDTVSITA